MADIYTRVTALETAVTDLQAADQNFTVQIADLAEDVANAGGQAVTDSGWLTLPLENGVLAYNEAQAPQYRKIGNMVYIRGVIKNMLTVNTVFATIPEGYRPSHRIIERGAMVAAHFYRLDIETTGEMKISRTTATVALTENNWFSLGMISYLTD